MSGATLRPEGGWPLWRRQALTVMWLELRRGLSIRRGWWLLFLAFSPLLIITMHALHDGQHPLPEETLVLAGIVQVFYVRLGIFFGCLGLAMRIVRGEVAERTLHYAFLAPVRREVLIVGRFLASALWSFLLFGSGVAATFVLVYGHFPAGREFLGTRPALAHLAAYLLATALTCLGYLSVSLAMSLLVKNPVLPAVILLLWEGINGMLPAWLKHFSVTFYVKPLFPVELPVEGISGLFTVVAEPTPAWLAVAGLLAFASLALALACWRVRRLEISYGAD